MAEETAISRYYFYSEKASDIARQLNFGALAIVWIFKTEWSGKPLLDRQLVWTTMWVVGSLFLDLSQYIVGGILWGRRAARKAELSAELLTRPSWWSRCFFVGKCFCLFAGYAILLTFLGKHVYAPK